MSDTEKENPVEEAASDENQKKEVGGAAAAPKPEISEEAKLRSRFPNGPMAGHSAFLQKRLNKGMKYFDSGDYQMAKQTQTKSRKLPLLAQPTGDAIPTPDSVPVRKTSIVQPNKLTSTAS